MESLRNFSRDLPKLINIADVVTELKRTVSSIVRLLF